MKQILVFLFFVSSYFANGQQLLTPYNGTLSTAAQQILQNYQADITLSYIDLYKLDATSLYGNTVNVDLVGNLFNFF